MMGEGRVFTVSEDDIRIEPFEIPTHYARICGIDFGIDHPAAAVWVAWDRDADTFYVHDCYRKAGETAVYHADAINKRVKVPVAWPHDGLNREKAGGQQLYQSYRDHGVNMLSMSARYDPKKGGGQPQEPIIGEILEYMKTGRWRVFSNLSPWFEEFRSYHRKDGRLVAVRDDILKATFYAVMMKRYAMPLTAPRVRHVNTRPVISARI
jgi:hypothetical protein